jgi:hypothetical protein
MAFDGAGGLLSGILRVPRAPDGLHLAIEREWDGAPCADARLHGEVMLSLRPGGLEIRASLPHQETPRVPSAPPGTRVADLYEYDVVECFLVGEGGRYLEVELGAGGHFLALSFDAPRVLADAHEDLGPELHFERGTQRWRSTLQLPAELLPPGICAVNAFVIAGGHHLAWHPLPGPRADPDFHQPDRFPPISLAS